MKIVLANSDYKNHMTDEGEQLQEGLRLNGWSLSGHGYDKMTDVKQILEEYKPSHVFVQDKRDWDKNCTGCFNHSVSYDNIDALKDYNGKKIAVVKDAGSSVNYQQQSMGEIRPDAIVTYYHDNATLDLSPFLRDYKRIRVYHSVYAERVPALKLERLGAVIAGAVNRSVYPLRSMIIDNANYLKIDVIKHPGYNNSGCQTYNFIEKISNYKVLIATASSYNFSLRKIIEGVACGCKVITDLPGWDILPEIDECLCRIDKNTTHDVLRHIIDFQIKQWDSEQAKIYAEKCKKFYDFRNQGKILNDRINEL